MNTTFSLYAYDITELDAGDSRLFGGKATGLARMAEAGIPVPPAFAISTDAFRAFQTFGRRLPSGLSPQVDAALANLSQKVGRVFAGDGRADPLLVSVRSGAQISMPGMMDTVLNLGLDAASAQGLIDRGQARGFVIDTWLRFWKMYAEIVLGFDAEDFVHALAGARRAAEAGGDLPTLEAAVVGWIEGEGEEAPTDPREQLDRTIAAVFSSWNSPRAKAYRDHQKIPHDLGTAVTVQAMVFGNADAASGSGVAFSRDPNTGAPVLYGEYLPGRQGEDIVAGTATPIDFASDDAAYARLRADLARHSAALEALYRDCVDIEFTVESGRLYLLQVRPAKRTAAAAVRIAADLVDEGLLSVEEALSRVSAEQVRRLLRPVFDPDQLAAAIPIATGIGSSPGQASGIIVMDSDRAAERVAEGQTVILVRPTTSPLDIRGMIASGGILTAKGGSLSHAAVVSRALDRPCVVGCEALEIDPESRTMIVNGTLWHEGDAISIDGTTGQVLDGRIDLVAPVGQMGALDRLLVLADGASGAEIWASGQAAAGAPGVAVLNMADSAISLGVVGDLSRGISQLAREPGAAALTLATAAARIGAGMAALAPGQPVHLRLPQPASRRAPLVVPDWLELDQRMFLPLGNPAYHRALLEGLSSQAATLTALLGGATDAAEWHLFRKEADRFSGIGSGVVIQNAAGLEALPDMLDGPGGSFWIDLDEVIDSAHGFLPKAYASSAVLDEYVTQTGLFPHPRQGLKPFLARLFRQVGARRDTRVGVICAADCDPGLLFALYGFGFRRFTVPREQRDLFRILLGKAAHHSQKESSA
jgi:pyruvate,orthophosphate dikinase